MIVGIDFGTTNSLVALQTERGPEAAVNERGARLTPSVVHFRGEAEVLVGETAAAQRLIAPDRTILRVKRRMGTADRYEILGRSLSPSDVGCLIFRKLRAYAGDYLKAPVERAVVTVPAYFDDAQRQGVLAAARAAGLQVVKLLNEPTAAALAYRVPQGAERILVVLDLGGGTFDITVLRATEALFEVLAVGGCTELGGADFDDLLLRWAQEEVRSRSGVDLSADPVARQQLLFAAERAKTDLSSVRETAILLPYIAQVEGRPIHVNLPLNRDLFERLAEPLFLRCRALAEETLAQAGIGPEAADLVIFSGGASRMPRFRREMEALFPGAQVLGGINPDEVVALGAAVCAAAMEGRGPRVELRDALPHDLGIRDDEGEFVPLLERGTIYPAATARMFTNARDGQEEVTVAVQQRRADRTVDLGDFRFRSNQVWRRGEANLAVSFAIDMNGCLEVSAEDVDTGEARTAVIDGGAAVLPAPEGTGADEWVRGVRVI